MGDCLCRTGLLDALLFAAACMFNLETRSGLLAVLFLERTSRYDCGLDFLKLQFCCTSSGFYVWYYVPFEGFLSASLLFSCCNS